MMPLVSIGMPVFNCEATLTTVIDSLLGQSLTDFELIISDNGSTDSTSAICQKYVKKDARIVYVRQLVNIGLYQNLKYVFDQGKGRYFLWAAGDDVRSSEFLEENVQFLEAHTDYVASTSPNCFEGQDPVEGNLVTFEIVGTIEERFDQFFKNCWQSHGIFYSVFRKEILSDCNVLGQSFTGADWAIDLLFVKHGNIHRTIKGLTIFGVNGVSMSDDPWGAFRNKFIEWIVPLYSLSAYVLSLSRDLPFAVRLKIMKRLLKLNLSVTYLPLYTAIHRLLYPTYCRYVNSPLQRIMERGTLILNGFWSCVRSLKK
jgi:glycosyltransferase involved in cell wall biosynthesis